MTVVARLPVDTAFVAMLRDNLQFPKAVYYGDSAQTESGMPPPDAPLPYAIVYAIDGGDIYGPPLTDPEGDVECIFQVTCVGGTSAQAILVADEVRTTVLGRNPTGTFLTPLELPAGEVIDRQSAFGMPGTSRTGKLWNAFPRFTLYVCGGG